MIKEELQNIRDHLKAILEKDKFKIDWVQYAECIPESDLDYSEQDVDFIAKAPERIEGLLNEVDSLSREVKRVQCMYDHLVCQINKIEMI